jgi:Uma2 family endonuclease
MVIQEKLVSAAEFLELANSPEYADTPVELVEGVIVTISHPKPEHGVNVVRVSSPMFVHVDERDLGYVTSDSGYILFTNPDGRDTVRGPDIAFVAKERLPNGLPDDFIPFAPDLAVEVVSPNDKVFEVEEKVTEYLRAGTKIVWVVSSYLKIVTVYTSRGITVYDINGTLDGGDVLPGFRLPVAAIFRR